MNKLQMIQSALKAPKGQRNTFGKYNYRSCEDIVEAVKPLLAEHELSLIISDEIIEIGGWIYVKATASLHGSSGDPVLATGFAREAETKKGMDVSQITGAASSYARKYALNGLLAIDDTKDADTPHHQEAQQQRQPQGKDNNKASLERCATSAQLKGVWANLPSEEKTRLAAVKNTMKAKLTEPQQ